MSELLNGSVPLEAYLLLAAVLFCTGVWGTDQQPQRCSRVDEH